MGSESIDVSLENIWKSWLLYRQGKKLSRELLEFQYDLEKNLRSIFEDLQTGSYQHGGYRIFVVSDNKKREISVASIRDRVVHRMAYDYLTLHYDKHFIYDAWSCRVGKGLTAAIDRCQQFLTSFPKSFVWRGDVRKFFDSVDHGVLMNIIARRIKDVKTRTLIGKIVESFSKIPKGAVGMPIGNLTSQIFANIYLNELDRFVTQYLHPKAYMRYGDDFIVISHDLNQLEEWRKQVIEFLKNTLRLQPHGKNNIIVKAQDGIHFLGVILYPKTRKLNKRNKGRWKSRLNSRNLSSYFALLQQHGNLKNRKEFHWRVLQEEESLSHP